MHGFVTSERPRAQAPWLLLALVCLPGVGWAQAQSPVRVEAIRVGLAGQTRVAAWTPVEVDLTAPSQSFEGFLEILTTDDDGGAVRQRDALRLSPGQVVTRTAYIRPGSISSPITVRVLSSSGRAVSPPIHPEDISEALLPEIHEPTDFLILALGPLQGIREVPARLREGGSQFAADELALVLPEQPLLPTRWYGLDAFQTLVIDTNDPAVRDLLRDRFAVLRQWVAEGGHLVVCAADGGQETAEVMGDLLPASLGGTRTLNDLGALEIFAGSSTNPIPGTTLEVARIEPSTDRGVRTLASSTDIPLVVRGPYGFGRVTLLGINPGSPQVRSWKDQSLFWIRALDLPRRGGRESTNPTTGNAFFSNETEDLAVVLHGNLDRPPGVRMVPFGWVAFFIFLYILLIGPLDYLFLKRVVKRMELTWITFPLIVVAVSGAAYAAAYALKGTVLKVVKVDVLDADLTSGRQRGSSVWTVFSPANQDYDLTLQPVPLDQPPPPPLLTELPEHSGFETDHLVSWFAPPVARFGAGNADQFNLADRSYLSGPGFEPFRLEGVRIPIWSTKSFSARWSASETSPVVEADLVRVGLDRLDGTITNLTTRRLRFAVLIFGDEVYDDLGSIEPGATVRIAPSSRVRPLSGYLQERAGLFAPQDDDKAETRRNPIGVGAIDNIIRTMLFRDAMNANARIPLSRAWRDLDLTATLEFDRAILMGSFDDAAAPLALDGGSQSHEVDQNTILRAIIPIDAETPGL